MAVGNALNIQQTGVVTFDGISVFTGSVFAQNANLIGGSNNSIIGVGPGASGTVLAGTGSTPIYTATPTVTSITISNGPVSGTDGANKTYVDTAVAAVNPATNVSAASTGAFTVTYLNGVSGIGATLTNAGAQAAFLIDGQSPIVGTRVLIKNQGSTFQNGVYTVTVVGSGITNWVLTRALDYDQASDINNTGIINVLTGTVNAGTGWVINSTVVNVGADAITYTQFIFAILPLANGGTGAAITASNGGIFYSNSSTGALLSGTATANQLLLSGASTTPSWSTSTYPSTNAINTILYASSANVMSALSTANSSMLITSATGVPSLGATFTPKTSWTPNLQINGSSTGITYSGQSGVYQQVGNVVYFSCAVILSSKGSGSGGVTISNLPVAVGTDGGGESVALTQFNGYTNATYPTLGMAFANGSTVGSLVKFASAETNVGVQSADISNSFFFQCNGFYFT